MIMNKDTNQHCQLCDKACNLKRSKVQPFKYEGPILGISMTGGWRVITFREIFNAIGIRKKVYIMECENCASLVFFCPYCQAEIPIQSVQEEKCPECSKKLYKYI